LKLLTWALAGLVPILVIGIWPTWRLAGSDGLAAMAAGAGISLFGSLIGSIVAGLLIVRNPQLAGVYIMGAAAVRSIIALGLGLTIALTTSLHPVPLLLWVVIAYLAALAGETIGLIRVVRHTGGRTTEAKPAV